LHIYWSNSGGMSSSICGVAKEREHPNTWVSKLGPGLDTGVSVRSLRGRHIARWAKERRQR